MWGVLLSGCVMAVALWPLETGACGGTFVAETGVIKSPGFPKRYPHNSHCVYNILASSDARLKLTCTKLNIEYSLGCTKDYLKINGINYCGKTVPENIYGEGQLTLEFVSDGSKNRKLGFSCKYQRVTGGPYVENTTPLPTTVAPTTAAPTTASSTTIAPTIHAPRKAVQRASCESLLTTISAWNTGWNGKVTLPILTPITSWTIVFEFTDPLTTFEQWAGTATMICSTRYSVYQDYSPMSAGENLSLEILYRFTEGSSIKSIELNGQNMCIIGGITGTTVTQAPYTGTVCTAEGSCYNYDEVLHKSLLFYEAQRSGDLPATNRVPWRKDSATNDAIDDVDLEGGYYDAGDYVKFGYPMAGMTTVLAWGAIEYGDAYTAAGEMSYMKDAVQWSTDYFIKAHPEPNVFYGQVGNGTLDHDYVGRPENMTMYRPAFKITTTKPGSDLAGETAAALAAAYVLFKDSNRSYADTCLKHAKQLYNFANKYKGKYSDSISDAAKFYNSSVVYDDELAWAAAWLYRATSNSAYLTDAKNHYSEILDLDNISEFSWAEKTPGVQVLLAEYADENDKSTYLEDLETFCDKIVNHTQRTPKGLVFISKWGSLRYAANAVFICLRAADLGINPSIYREFGKQQIHYMLGDGGRSYVVGFGTNPPERPHHASSSCPSAPTPCGWDTFNSNVPNPHVLYGALVGGPDEYDNYEDKRDDYIKNEVTTDYNAGFQSAVAALRSLANCVNKIAKAEIPSSLSTTPQPTTETTTPAPPSVGYTCAQVKVTNEWPSTIQMDLTVTFPVAVSAWDIVLTFSDAIDSVQAYTAVESVVSGRSVTLRNENYNGHQGAGASLVLGMQVTYSANKPTLSAISIGGIEICVDQQ